jgi:hypothetical protein
MLSELERALVQTRMEKLSDFGLVELFKSEYLSATTMLAKKDIFGNWIKHCICGIIIQ